jgi:glycosyltransferase involved in cell wall biosynthesis
LKEKIQRLSPDVVFIPTARWLNFGKFPVVVMVRNMEPLIYPLAGNPLMEKVKNISRIYAARKACQKATRVIAVSQYVNDFIHNKWGIGQDKIGIVYHGVDSPPVKERLKMPPALQDLKINRFIFTAGSIRPARGLEDIIDATGHLHKCGAGFFLIIAGGVDPGMHGYQGKLHRLALKHGISSRILWTGQLSAEEMSWCYYHCVAFVVTSRAEACPNIVLEALAHGCVSVSTETPPMPEFFKDVATYYPPKNPIALADAIRSVLEWNGGKRTEVSSQAKQRAAEFSWDVCAEKTLRELKFAMDQFAEKGRGKQ